MVVADVFAQAAGGVEGLLALPTRVPLQRLQVARKAKRQHCEIVLRAPSFSEDRGRKEDAAQTSKSAAPTLPQAPGTRRGQPQKGALRPQESRPEDVARHLEPRMHLPDRGSFSCGTRSSPGREPTPGTPGRSSQCSSAGACPRPCDGPQTCPSGPTAASFLEQPRWLWGAQWKLENWDGWRTCRLRTGGLTAPPHCGEHRGRSGDGESGY